MRIPPLPLPARVLGTLRRWINLLTGRFLVKSLHVRLGAEKLPLFGSLGIYQGLTTRPMIPLEPRYAGPRMDPLREVRFLASAARLRRHLSDAQKVALGRAFEAYFKPQARERQGERSDLKPKPNLPPNLGESQPPRQRESAGQAAAAVGMSAEQYRKGKEVSDKAPEPVRKAWEQDELSTHALKSALSASSLPTTQTRTFSTGNSTPPRSASAREAHSFPVERIIRC